MRGLKYKAGAHIGRKRVTQIFPFLLPVRVMQRKMCFYAGCDLMAATARKPLTGRSFLISSLKRAARYTTAMPALIWHIKKTRCLT